MAKLFEALDAPPVPATPAQLAAGRYVQAAKDIREQIRTAVNVMAEDAYRLGTTAIFAELAPDVAQGFAACLPILAQLWTAAAPDGVPFPTFPTNPPPPPPPPPPPDTTGGNGTDTTQGGAGN